MSFLPFSLSSLEYYLYHWAYFPSIFPHPFSLISLLVLFTIGLALMFKGNYSWNVIFGALGAYFGFIMGHYITTVVPIAPFPSLLAYVAGAVLGAILLIFLVRVFLSLGISYLAYMAVQTLFPGHIVTGGIVLLAVFLVAFILYRKIVTGIAAVIGAFIVWFTVMNFGVPTLTAQVLAAIMFALGLFIQINGKSSSREKRKGIRPFDQDTKWE